MVKTQKYKKEYALELMRIAFGDLKTAKILLDNPGGRPENLCFTAQQVIEKSVKAVLCHLEIEIPHTHSLELLFSLVPLLYRQKESEHWVDLTEYATIRRYEEGIAEIDQEDLQAAYDAAVLSVQWAKDLIFKE